MAIGRFRIECEWAENDDHHAVLEQNINIVQKYKEKGKKTMRNKSIKLKL